MTPPKPLWLLLHISCRAMGLLGLRRSCCRGLLAARCPLLGLLSSWTCKSSITHVPLGCFSRSGVFSSTWMVFLRLRWAARPCGLPAGTGPGLWQKGGGLEVPCSTS